MESDAVYPHFDPARPDPVTENITEFGQGIRENFAALRDAAFFGGSDGWTYSQSGGSAHQPAVVLYSKGVERIRYLLTWGAEGGAAGNVTEAALEYSNDAGDTYSVIEVREIDYDEFGNCIGGMPVLLLAHLSSVPGRLKSVLDTVADLASTYALRARTITAGTGLSGGGDLSADRTLAVDTAWGDARWLGVSNPTIQGRVGWNDELTLSTGSGSISVDWSARQHQAITINGNATFSLTNVGTGRLQLRVVGNNATQRTMSWSGGTWRWAGGVAPPAVTSANPVIITIYNTGTTRWATWMRF